MTILEDCQRDYAGGKLMRDWADKERRFLEAQRSEEAKIREKWAEEDQNS